MDRENNQNIRPFLMFLCSLIPGCAHMYLGLMKRGLQLLLAFLLSIGFASTFNGLEFLLIPLIIVVYVYSFFDGYSIYRNFKAGKIVEDESVITGLDSLSKIMQNAYWIGLVLIVFGVILAFNNLRFSGLFSDTFYYYLNRLDNFIPAVLLLILGVFLMVKGSKQRNKIKNNTQELSE